MEFLASKGEKQYIFYNINIYVKAKTIELPIIVGLLFLTLDIRLFLGQHFKNKIFILRRILTDRCAQQLQFLQPDYTNQGLIGVYKYGYVEVSCC